MTFANKIFLMADYSKLSWGDKRAELYENLGAGIRLITKQLIELMEKEQLTEDIENELNEIYYRKKAILNKMEEETPELIEWSLKNMNTH